MQSGGLHSNPKRRRGPNALPRLRFGLRKITDVAKLYHYPLPSAMGHLAKDLFFALQGDVRVNHDTVIVTYYNALKRGRSCHKQSRIHSDGRREG